MQYIRRDLGNINKRLCEDYVKKAEFTPVRNLVYGFVGLALTGVILALVNHVIAK